MQQNYTIIFQDVSNRAALIHISRNKNVFTNILFLREQFFIN